MQTTTQQSTEITGWKWNFAAGFVPLVAGLLFLVTSWWSMLHKNAFWSVGSLSDLDFTFQSIETLGKTSGPFLELLGSVGAVNIVIGAIAVIVISRFALRTGQRWAWYYLLFSFVWVGLHDAWATTRFFLATGQPALVMPFSYCLLMAIGLIRTRKQLFV